MKKIFFAAMLLMAAAAFPACTSDDGFSDETQETGKPDTPDEGDDSSDTDPAISDWQGEMADDAAADIVGTDEELYWEVNDFSTTVSVIYDSSDARVVSSSEEVLCDIQGAYVTLDLQTNSVQNVEIVVSGKSGDGGLKIYGQKKFKLTLAGVDLTSTLGPAINCQCKKRAFVHLSAGTINRLTDASSYGDDTYYLDGATSADEDRKGCLFSEGNLIFSGTGALVVEGRQKHGIATDGCCQMRPGVTIVVTGAARNALHVKGDSDDGVGIRIGGGLFYAHVASEAGKCMKTDLDLKIAGGKLLLNTSGDSKYDADENDTSSPACIKVDGNLYISGGTHTLKSTGEGGKGINADGTLTLDGGTVRVATSGGKYVYDRAQDLTSSPKGVKADGDIVINGGELDITVTGVSDGSEGLESKSAITINGGEVRVYAYDDAMNASTDITVNGGRVFCYAVNNDGIDSNGTLNVTGGVVIASGAGAPEEGFDCDISERFRITGGILIGTGGAAVSPSASGSQHTVIYNGLSATQGSLLCICDSSGDPILVYALPRTMSGMSLLFSSPDLVQGSYTVLTDGSATGSVWNGWYSDPLWAGGTQINSFTIDSIVTMIGNSGGPGGGGTPGGPDGGRP